MNARHFASRATGHALVADLRPQDVRFWYDGDADMITPFLRATFCGDEASRQGWTPILASGNGDWSSGWGPALAAAERPLDRGVVRLCHVDLAGRVQGNPVAYLLAGRLLGLLPAPAAQNSEETPR